MKDSSPKLNLGSHLRFDKSGRTVFDWQKKFKFSTLVSHLEFLLILSAVLSSISTKKIILLINTV